MCITTRIHAMAEFFEDRVMITNRGGLPVGLGAKTIGTISVPRNLLIAYLLHKSNYIEQIGT